MRTAGLYEAMATNKERFTKEGQETLILKELTNRFELEGITYFFLGNEPRWRCGGLLISTFIDDCNAQEAILIYDEVDTRIISGFRTLLPQPWSIRPRWRLSEPNAALAEINLKVIDCGVTVPVYDETRGTALVSIADRGSDAGGILLDEFHLPELTSFAALLHGAAFDWLSIHSSVLLRG